VQANKAGLLEIADVLAVNKADRPGGDETVRDLRNMIEWSGPRDWAPPIVETVATEGRGVDDLWDAIAAHRAHLERDGRLATRRAARLRDEIEALVAERLGRRAGAVCTGARFDELLARPARPIGFGAVAAAWVRVEDHGDGVALLRVDRPPLNALSQAVLAELAEAAQAVAGAPDVRAVVVAGGARAFAAGADIEELETADPAAVASAFRVAFDAVAAIPRPVVAAIRGVALGGGLELALACDLRVAADSARLGQPEVLLGLIPGAGGTQRLARLVGPARAKELVWSGRHVRADEAHTLGLVDRVAPDGATEAAALDWARSFAGGAVAAMGLAKAAIDRGLDGSLAAGLDVERRAFVEVFDTEDAAAGIRSFLERGPGRATFRGR
jgi:enoyl-CoA hydratase